jgi:hypothetical protein
MKRTLRPTVTVGIALVLVGCGLIGSSGNPTPRGARDVTLLVINQNFLDASLYAVWSNGRRFRIGDVTGNTEREFSLRRETNSLQVQIRLLSVEGSYLTDPMSVFDGDYLELVVDPGLDKRIRIRRPGL